MKQYHYTFDLGPYHIKVYRDDIEDFGEYSEADQEIRLNHNIASQEALADTVIHECVEAVNAVYGLELGHPAIQTLGAGLSQMLGNRLNLKTDKITVDDDLALDDGDGD